MNKIDPYIHMNAKAINQQDDINDPEYNPDMPLLFDVFIAEQEMKINFIVRWNDPDAVPPPKYEFEVIKVRQMFLSGIDEVGDVKHTNVDEAYPQPHGPAPSLDNADPTIVYSMFDRILGKYKITLNSIVMHNFTSFESDNFVIDTNVLEEIKEKVNKLCCKIKHDVTYRG